MISLFSAFAEQRRAMGPETAARVFRFPIDPKILPDWGRQKHHRDAEARLPVIL